MTTKALFSLFSSQKDGSWIMNPLNGDLLYSFVRASNVIRILDLGTGIGFSAAVMALALKDSGRKGEIHTVEQNKKCIDMAKGLIPKELQEYITFHHAEWALWKNPLIPHTSFSTFKTLPKGNFDFWMVDGPGPIVIGEGAERKLVELPNGDVMKNIDKMKPGTFVAWDGRIAALKAIERYYGDNFYLAFQGTGSDFNVIERKNNKAQINDMKLEDMMKMGYV